MPKLSPLFLLSSVVVVCAVGCARPTGEITFESSPSRPTVAASNGGGASHVPPQRACAPGLANCYRVSDQLYRGGEIGWGGVEQLKALGVRTVFDLRWEGSDILWGSGLSYEHIPFWTYTVKDEYVIRFLRAVCDPARAPVYVHCRKGADRTGFMCAVYRVVVENWSRQEAIREMVYGGFGFDSEYQNLIRYVETMDVAALRRRAGLPEQTPPT